MQKSNHLEYIDSAKGVLIILVVLGHVFLMEKYMYFAYTFHLPSFLIITGILLFHVNKTERPLFKNFVSAFYTFIIPFLFFETIGGVLKYINNTLPQFPQAVIDPFIGNCHVGADWYLLTAFFAEMLFLITEKIRVHKYLRIVFYVLLFVIGCLLPRDQFRYVFIARILIASAFIAIGYYLYSVYTSVNKWLIVFAFIVTVLCTEFNGFVSLYSVTLGNPILYFAGSVCGAYFCIALCHLFTNRLLSEAGRNSLTIMGTHQNFINYVHIERMPLFLLICVAEIPIVLMLRKYLPFCIGVKKRK